MTGLPTPGGRIALVSGGTFGIGRATAVALAKQNLTVVITGRDAARAQEAVAAIQQQSGNPQVSYLLADFFRPAQVRALAETFMATHDRLDILVNNAGINATERRVTPDGLEQLWTINHLAYMQLSLALLPLLKASAPSRIVNVASALYAKTLDFQNLQGERRWNGNNAYLASKLGNLLFTYALARRLEGTGVTVNAVNPGLVDTGLGRGLTGATKFIYNVLFKPFKVTPEQGAAPAVYLATSPEVEGVSGRFYNKTKFVPTTPATHDQSLQERLWRVSLQQLGLAELAEPVAWSAGQMAGPPHSGG